MRQAATIGAIVVKRSGNEWLIRFKYRRPAQGGGPRLGALCRYLVVNPGDTTLAAQNFRSDHMRGARCARHPASFAVRHASLVLRGAPRGLLVTHSQVSLRYSERLLELATLNGVARHRIRCRTTRDTPHGTNREARHVSQAQDASGNSRKVHR